MSWWNRPGLKNFDGIVCDGAVRSGKTLCMSVGFFLWSMAEFDSQVFALCGRTVGSLRRNIIDHLPKWLGPDFRIRSLRTENKLVVCWSGRQNTYYLFGGAEEGTAGSIQGMTLAGALLDEAALLNRGFLEQACARCSVTGSKLWFNCNPEGPEHWFYTQWVCKAGQKNLLRLTFTMQDNPALDESIRQRYERMYTGVFYRRFVLGQWCRTEGLVYEFDREKHVAKQLTQGGRYYISVDYGTMNPFSAGLWCVSGGKAVRIREFYYDGRQQGRAMTDEEYYRALEKLAGEQIIEKVIVDPSAASFIAAIRAHGRFSVRKARNHVLPGIQLVARLLEEGAVLIGPQCRDTIREFGLYAWEDGSKDIPRKENDHAMDDVRYFCATVMGRRL